MNHVDGGFGLFKEPLENVGGWISVGLDAVMGLRFCWRRRITMKIVIIKSFVFHEAGWKEEVFLN